MQIFVARNYIINVYFTRTFNPIFEQPVIEKKISILALFKFLGISPIHDIYSEKTGCSIFMKINHLMENNPDKEKINRAKIIQFE